MSIKKRVYAQTHTHISKILMKATQKNQYFWEDLYVD